MRFAQAPHSDPPETFFPAPHQYKKKTIAASRRSQIHICVSSRFTLVYEHAQVRRKTDLFCAQTERSGKMDAKPTLETEDLRYCAQHGRRWRLVMNSVIVKDTCERKKTNSVVYRWRKKQARSFGYKVEDPDPYDPSYVFFCLEGEREK